jgi:hypothetical protein
VASFEIARDFLPRENGLGDLVHRPRPGL